MNNSSALDRLAAAKGLVPEFKDINRKVHRLEPDTQMALLGVMGLAVETEKQAAEALAALQAEDRARTLPRHVAHRVGKPLVIPVSAPLDWHLQLEDGSEQSGRAETEISLDPPLGLHRLRAGDCTCPVIVAPARAPSVQDKLGRARGWGVMAALYGLGAPFTFGLGNYLGLRWLATRLGGLGADFIGINPIHSRGAAHDGYSPYSPSSRVALETGHINMEQLIEKGADHGDLVDYRAGRARLDRTLPQLYGDFFVEFPNSDLPRLFADWRESRGEPLERFARFEALSLKHGEDWRHWPADLQNPNSEAVAAFARENAEEIDYQAFLQFMADDQLTNAKEKSKAAGMGLGLYLDLAVGVRPNGADCWCWPEAFIQGASLGAPPDDFNPQGQVWNLAPFSPDGLVETEFAPFIAMLKSAMSYAGMLRIDHVLGFKRGFWVPENGAPGAYVTYPFEAMMALTLLEAHRHDCVVVGEDLGTVPPGFRGSLAENGLLGCAVMQFEREGGDFRAPKAYRQHALASFGSHDTPTLRGWWRERDIDWRKKLGQYDQAGAQAARMDRDQARIALIKLLKAEKLLVDDATDPDEDSLSLAIHELLAKTRSELVAVQLDDMLGVVEQQNLPGTTTEHPNWRRRCPVPVDQLPEQEHLKAIADIMNRVRKT